MPFLTRDVGAVAAALGEGKIAAFPTETVYGLGAAVGFPEGVANVFRAKRRPAEHPLIVHVGDFAAFRPLAAEIPAAAAALAERFLPGPLTMILRKSGAVPESVTGGRATVALRAPSHPQAQELLRKLGQPVAAPSANAHGRTSATAPGHVMEEFADLPDLPVLDGGRSPIGIESAIVDLSDPAAPRLLRSGALPLAEIREALGVDVEDLSSSVHSEASGGMERHYSPGKPLALVAAGEIAALAESDPACGLISAERPQGHSGPWLRMPSAPEDCARELYAMLRDLDAADCARIAAEEPPQGMPGWDAIRDRLRRASR